ncbi:MAG TPA: hypothetical protein VFC63_04100 [Blastocatellia bacterium]|nr:hypothetical protein [Blastocatellia bacterium]
MEKPIVHVIVWGSEVELKGLPQEIRQEAEKTGGFWVGTGLRLPAEKYHNLRESHPELQFEVYPKDQPIRGSMNV